LLLLGSIKLLERGEPDVFVSVVSAGVLVNFIGSGVGLSVVSGVDKDLTSNNKIIERNFKIFKLSTAKNFQFEPSF